MVLLLPSAPGSLDLSAPISGAGPFGPLGTPGSAGVSSVLGGAGRERSVPTSLVGCSPGAPELPPAWLTELLGGAFSSPPSPSPSPSLALASALPPIPGKAVDKISKGLFIEFKELLADNVALALSKVPQLDPG